MAGYDFKHFDDLLRDGQYLVPEYQRFFSWETSQIQDLWEDLNNINVSGQANHFCGTVVVERMPDEKARLGKTLRKYKIVDGQQRLVTLSILMFSMYKRLKSLNSEASLVTARNILTDYIYDIDLSEYRLVLNGDDASFYRDCVVPQFTNQVYGKVPETHSQKRLVEAKTFFEQRFENADETYLEELLTKILTKLIFIRYEVGDEIEAGMVFEAMNDRGRALTQVDKIKNYLIFLAYKEDDRNLGSEINTAFGEIYSNLMKVDPEDSTEDDILRYHWILFIDDDSSKDISRTIKTRLRVGSSDLRARIREYVTSLKEVSYVYLRICRPDLYYKIDGHEHKAIVEYLNGLHRIRGIATFYPILIASSVCYQHLPARFEEVCRMCQTWSVRLNKILGERPDLGAARFNDFAHKFYSHYRRQTNSNYDYQTFMERVKTQLQNRASRFEISFRLRSSRIYNDVLKPHELRFILFEYENFLARTQGEPSLDWSELSSIHDAIEHILPQRPRGIGEWDADRRRSHEQSVDKLGNLTLTFWNATLSNKDFADKRQKYAESKLLIQRKLADHEEWGEEQIKGRTESLIEFILDRWQIT